LQAIPISYTRKQIIALAIGLIVAGGCILALGIFDYVRYLDYLGMKAQGIYCSQPDYTGGNGRCLDPSIPYDRFIIGAVPITAGVAILVFSWREILLRSGKSQSEIP
jgi:hypothetical protein